MNGPQQLIGPEAAVKLIRTAMEMRKRSYCPYSSFSVGAALMSADGSIYTGCNAAFAAKYGIEGLSGADGAAK